MNIPLEGRLRNKISDVQAYSSETMCVGMARVGWDNQKIVYCSLQELAEFDGMGDPLHSLIIPGQTHPLEVQMLETFKLAS